MMMLKIVFFTLLLLLKKVTFAYIRCDGDCTVDGKFCVADDRTAFSVCRFGIRLGTWHCSSGYLWDVYVKACRFPTSSVTNQKCECTNMQAIQTPAPLLISTNSDEVIIDVSQTNPASQRSIRGKSTPISLPRGNKSKKTQLTSSPWNNNALRITTPARQSTKSQDFVNYRLPKQPTFSNSYSSGNEDQTATVWSPISSVQNGGSSNAKLPAKAGSSSVLWALPVGVVSLIFLLQLHK